METINLRNTILVNQSFLDTIKVGRFYTTLRKGNKFYIFDNEGKQTPLSKTKLKWKEMDDVVMLVKINSSLLDSVLTNNIYRVFNDDKNDERYIFDENREKVLFDGMIFNYELI